MLHMIRLDNDSSSFFQRDTGLSGAILGSFPVIECLWCPGMRQLGFQRLLCEAQHELEGVLRSPTADVYPPLEDRWKNKTAMASYVRLRSASQRALGHLEYCACLH